MGIGVSSSFEQIAAVIAEHKTTMQPERRSALVEQGVVEGTQRECLPLLLFVLLPELQKHQLADAVDEVGRIEGAPFGLATRAALLHESFLPEEPDALLDGHILCVQADADDEAREPNERFGKLPELHAAILPQEARFDHHLLAVMGPSLDEEGGPKI